MSEHKHAALISEWIKDTSRVVECMSDGEVWVKVDGHPIWSEYNEYRFAPVKSEVTSPLSDDARDAEWNSARDAEWAAEWNAARAAGGAKDAARDAQETKLRELCAWCDQNPV